MGLLEDLAKIRRDEVVFTLTNEVTGITRRWLVKGMDDDKLFQVLGDVRPLERLYGVLDGGGEVDPVENRWEIGFSSYEIDGVGWSIVVTELLNRLRNAGYNPTRLKSRKA